MKLIIIISSLIIMGCTQVSNGHDQRCSIEAETGPCRAAFLKYFFNENSGHCEVFTWGGCQGVVPFDSKEACSNICLTKPSSQLLIEGNNTAIAPSR